MKIPKALKEGDDMMTMGELIRYHRKRLEWSQEELGNRLNPQVNKAAINKWENGTVENIKRTHIQQMAGFFGLSPCELMCWQEEKPKLLVNTKIAELIDIFNQLNEEGQNELLNYAKYVSSQKKYESVKKEYKNA